MSVIIMEDDNILYIDGMRCIKNINIDKGRQALLKFLNHNYNDSLIYNDDYLGFKYCDLTISGKLLPEKKEFFNGNKAYFSVNTEKGLRPLEGDIIEKYVSMENNTIIIVRLRQEVSRVYYNPTCLNISVSKKNIKPFDFFECHLHDNVVLNKIDNYLLIEIINKITSKIITKNIFDEFSEASQLWYVSSLKEKKWCNRHKILHKYLRIYLLKIIFSSKWFSNLIALLAIIIALWAL